MIREGLAGQKDISKLEDIKKAMVARKSKIDYTIYQLPPNLSLHESYWDEKQIKRGNYLAVYKGEITSECINIALEKLFETFNMNHPIDYPSRSMSVGDVVKLDGDYYLCAPMGWQKLDDFK